MAVSLNTMVSEEQIKLRQNVEKVKKALKNTAKHDNKKYAAIYLDKKFIESIL